MTTRAVFAYENLDDTADLNAHFKALVSRGVITGGKILPVAGTSNITISSFYAASVDGMIIWSDSAVTVACSPGQVNYIVLRAVYNAPADPTLSYECMNASAYASDPQASSLILFGTVNLTAVATVSAASISYATRDVVDKVSHVRFLGSYSTAAERDNAWPTVQPVAQKPNDFVLVTNAVNSMPAFYFWNGTAWAQFGNYEQLASDFSSHVAGVVGTGDNVHNTLDEKAALKGTNGTPSSSNRFVTESDPNLILTPDQKSALANAVSGPVKATNPVVSNNVPMAVPAIVSFTPSNAQDYVNIQFANNGTGPFFGVPVFVGRLGIDTVNNRSTAAGWFTLQDSFFNGYIDDDGPLYVTDVQDYTGSGSYNPASDTQSVSSIGYWSPVTGTSALRIKFNRALAAQKTVYIRCYVQGTVAKLAPGGAYYPPATAQFIGQISYQDVFSQKVRYQQAQYSEIQVMKAYAGSASAPSITFKDNVKTGFYYAGNIAEIGYVSYSTLGASVDGDTVLVLGKTKAGNDTSLEANEMPLVIEQTVSETGEGKILVHAHKGTDASPSLSSLDFGLSSYTAGFSRYFVVGTNDEGKNGVTFVKNLYSAPNAQFVAASGSEAAPSITFAGNTSTGFYYVGTKQANTQYPETGSVYNSVGLTLNGNTCFLFSSNTIDPTADSSTPMVFEQFTSPEVEIGYRIGAIVRTSITAVISFGSCYYNKDWVEYGNFSDIGLNVLGTIVDGSTVSFSTGFSIQSKSDTSIALTDPEGRYKIDISSGSTLIKNTVVSVDGNLYASKALRFTGTSTTAGYTSIGTELAPAIQFGDSNNGIFCQTMIKSTSTEATSTDYTQQAVCFVSGGSTVLAVGKNTVTAGDITDIEMPFIIEQNIKAGQAPRVQLSLMERMHYKTRAIQIGFGGYNQVFESWMDFNSLPDADLNRIGAEVSINKSLHIQSTAQIDDILMLNSGYLSMGGTRSELKIGTGTQNSFNAVAVVTPGGQVQGSVDSRGGFSFTEATAAGLMYSTADSAIIVKQHDTSGISISNSVVTGLGSRIQFGSTTETTTFIGGLLSSGTNWYDCTGPSYAVVIVGTSQQALFGNTLWQVGATAPAISKVGAGLVVECSFTDDMTSRNGAALALKCSVNASALLSSMPVNTRTKIDIIVRVPSGITPSWIGLYVSVSGVAASSDLALGSGANPKFFKIKFDGDYDDAMLVSGYIVKTTAGVDSAVSFIGTSTRRSYEY